MDDQTLETKKRKRRRMTCHLKGVLRSRFDIAWRMLPTDVAERLGNYIWFIKSSPALDQIDVVFPDGSVVIIDGPSAGLFCADEYSTTGCIWIVDRLESEPEWLTVFIILHELAHANDYMEDLHWRSQSREVFRAELAAHAQVVNWAARDAYKPSYGGYKHAHRVADKAHSEAEHLLVEWMNSSPKTLEDEIFNRLKNFRPEP